MACFGNRDTAKIFWFSELIGNPISSCFREFQILFIDCISNLRNTILPWILLDIRGGRYCDRAFFDCRRGSVDFIHVLPKNLLLGLLDV